MDNNNEKKILIKCQRNKISLLLISFYSGVIAISDLGVKYYLKDEQKLNTSTFSSILLIIKVAYLIKPIFGLLIDFLPIFGYKKKIYLLLCFIINIFCWYLFILRKNDNLLISLICQLLINITISFSTVIGSAIQVEISKLRDKQNTISTSTLNLMSQYFIVKSIGTLIPSFFKGFLVEKYSNDILFYISGIISILLLLSAIILDEDRISKKKTPKILKKSSFTSLIKLPKKDIGNSKIETLINNKNYLILLLLVIILESSPSCVSPLFYYETNILGLNPKNLGLIDFTSSITIIVFIYTYENYISKNKYNFKTIIFCVRILIFGSFSLIYLLITKSTQEYISDFVLIAFATSLNAGLHSLGQLPYNLLCIKFSPFGLEATSYSFCVFSCYLGNILADYIDYVLAIYFNITHHNFTDLGKLVFIENIINLIPLLYIWIIPKSFFSEKKRISSATELSSLEKDKIENKKTFDYRNKNKNNYDIEEDNESIIDDIINNIVGDNDIDDNIERNELNIPVYQNSYRYLNY